MSSTLVVLLAALISILVITVASIMWLRYQQKITNDQQRIGLSALSALQVLMSSIQQHRGLANGYIHGEVALHRALIEVREKVHDQITRIESASDWVVDKEYWHSITESWAKILASFPQSDPTKSFRTHSALVRNILVLIGITAHRYHLPGVDEKTTPGYTFLWQQLLSTAELLGQARGLGIGVVVDGECTNTTRKQMEKLVAEIERDTELLSSQLDEFGPINELIQRFLETIETQLLKESPTIEAMEYFSIASAAIDSLYQHYNEALRQLSVQIFNKTK